MVEIFQYLRSWARNDNGVRCGLLARFQVRTCFTGHACDCFVVAGRVNTNVVSDWFRVELA